MDRQVARPGAPFAFAGALIGIVTLALFRLPQLYVAQLERNRALSDAQAGWAYRLLAFVAVGQAAYGGFVLLSTERVRSARRTDPKVKSMSSESIVRSLARIGAFMCVLTIVYGLASFVVTGQRAGYWLFVVVAIAQGSWYYRQVGQVAAWLRFQPEAGADERPRVSWQREPPDYSPPLARGLIRRSAP